LDGYRLDADGLGKAQLYLDDLALGILEHKYPDLEELGFMQFSHYLDSGLGDPLIPRLEVTRAGSTAILKPMTFS
jgi:hypothetical protein